MENGILVATVATWTRFAIVIFCVAVGAAFLLTATRKLWARSGSELVTGPAAKLAFVVASFAVLVVVALSVCDLVAGVEAKEPLTHGIGTVAAYTGVLLGFRVASKLDSVIQPLLPSHGLGRLPGVGGKKGYGAGLRRIGPAPGTLCWVCGKSKVSAEHLAGCPAGKGGV